jgi:hypothetical protein
MIFHFRGVRLLPKGTGGNPMRIVVVVNMNMDAFAILIGGGENRNWQF